MKRKCVFLCCKKSSNNDQAEYPDRLIPLFSRIRGLDNAGKTTILKRINGEPIDTVSPTLGFNIKTLEHER